MKLNLYFENAATCRKRDVLSQQFKNEWKQKELEALTCFYSGKFKVEAKKTDA